MKQNILLTFARGYRMEKDDKTGYNEGISVNYLLTDDLSPFVGDKIERGIRFSKSSISLEDGKAISKVPGLYEGNFAMRTDAKGNTILKLESVNFLSEVQLDFPGLSKKS